MTTRKNKAILAIAMATIISATTLIAMVPLVSAVSKGDNFNYIGNFSAPQQKVLIGQNLQFNLTEPSNNFTTVPTVFSYVFWQLGNIYYPDTYGRIYGTLWPESGGFPHGRDYFVNESDMPAINPTLWEAELWVQLPNIPTYLKVNTNNVTGLIVGTPLRVDTGGINLFDEDRVDLLITDPYGIKYNVNPSDPTQVFRNITVAELRDFGSLDTSEQINTTGWKIGMYTFQVRTAYNGAYACGLDVQGAIKVLGIYSSIPVHNLNTGEGFFTIQDAIYSVNTKNGHTIEVDPGTYMENVVVNKSLTIQSFSGDPADTIVEALDVDKNVFTVSADYVNISGFTVTNATNGVGIYLDGVKHGSIIGNIVHTNNVGIVLMESEDNNLSDNIAFDNIYFGINLHNSSHNLLRNNTASYSVYQNGIHLSSTSNFNSLIDNRAFANGFCGIEMTVSSNNTLSGNTVSSNDYHGIRVHYSGNNTLTGNIASNNVHDGIDLEGLGYNTLTGNTVNSNHEDGVFLYYSGYNTLTGNTVNSNLDNGIELSSSSYNNLTGNTVNSNTWDGIHLHSSSNNNMIYNNFFENTVNAWDECINFWNLSDKAVGTNIIGGYYLGGNYWSDYAGTDTDVRPDGLGDTLVPYNSSGNILYGGDYLPLSTPVAHITSPREIEILSELVEIKGYAWDPVPGDFANYTVEYQPFGDDTSTEITTSTTPVFNGVLATWDTSSLSCNNYWLRLLVFDTAGNKAEHKIVVFRVGCVYAGEIGDDIMDLAERTEPFQSVAEHPNPIVAYIPVTYADQPYPDPNGRYPKMEAIGTLKDRANLTKDYYFNQSHGKITLQNEWIFDDWRVLQRYNDSTGLWEDRWRDAYGSNYDDVINDAIRTAQKDDFDVTAYDAIVVVQPEWRFGSVAKTGTALALTSDQRSYASWAHEIGHVAFKFTDHYTKEDYVSHGDIFSWGLMGNGTMLNPPPTIMIWHQGPENFILGGAWIQGYNVYTPPRKAGQSEIVPVELLSDYTQSTLAPVYRYYSDGGQDFYYYMEGRAPDDAVVTDPLIPDTGYDWYCRLSADCIPRNNLEPKTRGVQLYFRSSCDHGVYTVRNYGINTVPAMWNTMTLVPGSSPGNSYTWLDGTTTNVKQRACVRFNVTEDGAAVEILRIACPDSSVIVTGFSEIGPYQPTEAAVSWYPDLDLKVETSEGITGVNYETMQFETPVPGTIANGPTSGGGPEAYYFPDKNKEDILRVWMDSYALVQWAQELGITPPPTRSETHMFPVDDDGNLVVPSDQSAPVITSISPEQGGDYTAGPVTLDYTVEDEDPDLTLSPAPGSEYTDPGEYAIQISACDSSGNCGYGLLSFKINRPPSINTITVTPSVVPLGDPITLTATFTDPDSEDTHTAEWDWGDGNSATGTVTESDGSGTVSDTYTYAAPGVYTVTLDVTDNHGASDSADSAMYQYYAVVYDPSAGFVTGGGWIDSPPGAYAADETLTGKATFGFVSKYKKGADVPTGVTQFQFKVADLKFHSESYDWLVVSGDKARYKGDGTINGIGNYGFMLTAIDGDIKGGTDKFRIKIWDMDADDTVIYDNKMGSLDDSDDATEIGGGSIVIHTG